MPLGARRDFGDAQYAGVDTSFSCDVVNTLSSLLGCGFDFIVTPLVHPRYRRPAPSALPKSATPPPFTHSDLLLSSSQWSSQVVGRVSPWIQPDSANEALQRDSACALRQELEWAAHLSLQACIIPLPPSLHNANYARVLLQVMQGLSNMAVWVQVPLVSVADQLRLASSKRDRNTPGGQADSWEWWNRVRCLCEHNAKLGVLLEVPADLPEEACLARWAGEPVRALLLPTSVFLTNRRGFPTLSKPHQDLLVRFFRLGVQVVLSGKVLHAPLAPASPAAAAQANGEAELEEGEERGLAVYHEYLSFLFRKPDALTPQEQLEMQYRDYLQVPLQPLQDNLESQTYETFEKDVTKYATYEEAVHDALLDRVPEDEAAERVTVLMVVGAGRGPLVRASLRAAKRCRRRMQVYAVEKNPNAVVTLQNLVVSEGWEEEVTVVAADMREWEAPEPADILVSELLGSFGDNELSPECLDGAQRFLRSDGVSIPTSYTSYIQPITSHKLWNDVKAYDDLKHFETPYVVKLHRFTPLARTRPVFTFAHPNRAPVIDNTRSADLRFERRDAPAAVCHGFAGYFDAQLYGDVRLSTHPPSHTPNMFSWFPIYFPLREPLHCPAGAPLDLHLWRCAAHHKVWYEWAVTAPAISNIHNPTGRSYYVGL